MPFRFCCVYFEERGILLDWPAFLNDFQHHWPTDADDSAVESRCR
jgi:hypothetical protein